MERLLPGVAYGSSKQGEPGNVVPGKHYTALAMSTAEDACRSRDLKGCSGHTYTDVRDCSKII